MKLYPISVSRLQMLESGQFIYRFISDFESSGQVATTDAEFKTQFDLVKAKMIPFNLGLLQVKAHAETEALINLDLRRDRKFIVIRRAISVYEYSDDSAELNAYQEADVILRKYKTLEKDNYEAETLGIENFIIEIRNAPNQAIDTLNLGRHVDNLEVANEEFKVKFNARSSEIVSTVAYDTKQLRADVFTVYNKLAKYVLMMADYKGTEFFITTLRAVNTGRAYFADVIARREGIANRDNPES